MGLPQHRRRPSHCSQGSEMKQSIKIKHLDLFFFLQSSEMTLNLNPPLAPQLTSRPTKKMQTKSLTSKTQLLDYRKTLPNFTAQPDLCCSNLYSLSLKATPAFQEKARGCFTLCRCCSCSVATRHSTTGGGRSWPRP